MSNHKWEEHTCVKCGLQRDWRPYKLRMAMVGSRDYYKYGASYVYIRHGMKDTRVRPECLTFNPIK